MATTDYFRLTPPIPICPTPLRTLPFPPQILGYADPGCTIGLHASAGVQEQGK